MSLTKDSNMYKYAIVAVLFSIYPVIFYYAYNLEMLSLRQLCLPLGFAFLLALATFLGFTLLLRSPLKGSLAAVSFLLYFWFYELFFQAVRALYPIRGRFFLLLSAALLLMLLLIIRRTKRNELLKNVSTVLMVVGLFLIVINLFTIIPGEMHKFSTTAQALELQLDGRELNEAEGTPDLYLLIFDEYARLDTMEREWGYDNSAFREHLEREGFFLVERSRVNYPSTANTMPELLNVTHLDADKSEAQLIELYYNNLLFSFFNELGYQVFFLDGYNHPLKRNMPAHVEIITYADSQRTGQSLVNDAFIALLFFRSLLSPFEEIMGIERRGILYYEGNRAFFDFIKNVGPQKERPKFIFAHIWFPHLPYVFDREGNFTDNRTHFFEHAQYRPEELKQMYLEQYIYATVVIEEMIAAIKENNENEAIIIFQSDHGPRPSSAGNSNDEEAYRVLNAVYFPDGDYSSLDKEISPVNTMRVVLNQFFGQSLKMLD